MDTIVSKVVSITQWRTNKALEKMHNEGNLIILSFANIKNWEPWPSLNPVPTRLTGYLTMENGQIIRLGAIMFGRNSDGSIYAIDYEDELELQIAFNGYLRKNEIGFYQGHEYHLTFPK